MDDRFSYSRIPLKPFYTPEDIAGNDYTKQQGNPGEFPFTRGIRLNPIGNEGWIPRELAGEGSPANTNRQLKYLLEKGQTGIDIIGDSPTMSCLDPDHPLGRASVGTQGVSLCRMQDFIELYDGIPLGELTISNSLPPYFGVAGLYLAARHQGVDSKKLRGSAIQAVMYGEDCSYGVNLPLSMRTRLATDSIRFCIEHLPRYHSFLEDTYFISETGLDAVEEMALGFVEIRYLTRNLLAAGVDIDAFAPRIAILLNCKMDFFEEIAKVRATRRLFARMMKEDFGAKDPRSLAVVIASHTSGLALTGEQAFNNISRGAIQAMALALAGVQAVEISGFDEAYRTPSPESHLVGLRTQQVIQAETNVGQVSDPLGGSYFVESLTDELAQRIWAAVEQMEGEGDIATLSEGGYFRRIMVQAMERHAQQISDKTLQKVGVNLYQIPEEDDKLLKEVKESKIDTAHKQIETIIQFKQERPQSQLSKALSQLLHHARSSENNLMVPIIDGFEAGATIGEMTGVLRLASGLPYDPFELTQPPCELNP